MGLFEILKGEQPGLIKSLLHYENVGQYGEYLTEYALLSRSMEGYYVVLKNLYLPMKGKTTEIDLLMIHEKGIFVFESKNYSGWIFGSEDQLKWTQCFKSGQREHFYNPYKAESHTYQSFGDFPQYARRCLFFLYCIFGTMRTEKDSAIR